MSFEKLGVNWQATVQRFVDISKASNKISWQFKGIGKEIGVSKEVT